VVKARWAGWGGRSFVFYAWFGGAIQVLFLVGAVAFVLVGSRYQRGAIDINSHAQQLQLSNQTIEGDFLDAQRSVRGFVLTGQDRFLQSYYAERADFAAVLNRARALAWPGAVSGLVQEGDIAEVTFALDDRAITFPPGGPRSEALLKQASAWSGQFVVVHTGVQARLAAVTRTLAADSQRSLGIGLTGAAIVLTVALMIPAALTAAILGWSLPPIIGNTNTVRRLAAGDHAARAVPGGPAETRDLSVSINVLADESDRLRAEQEENARLSIVVRQTAMRVREHLDAEGVTREAVAAIAQNLACDYVWVGLVNGAELTLPAGNREDWSLRHAVIESIPPEYIELMADLYRQRASFCLQDLRSEEAAVIPGRLRDLLRGLGGTSLLFTPFGTGRELLGELTLLRSRPDMPWTPAEISAVESVATEVGRGLDHANLYAQQKDLVEKLKDLDRAKSDFLAAVSHDLRAPLTSIVGYAEMLGEDGKQPLDGEQRQMLNAIDRNASRLQNLIDDVLTMSRIETGAFETKLRPVELTGVVRAAVGEIRVSAEEKGLDLRLSCPEQGLTVNADPDQLDRAMTNLLSNAVKYTPSGGRVGVSVHPDGGQAVVTVSDTGIGIPEKDQGSLFTRFFRASNAVTRSIPGTGLGLAIVSTIVSNHHGEVKLWSREGAGTTVTLGLPLSAHPDGDGPARPQDPAASTAGPGEVPPTPGEGDAS
jgi:two-component system, OmpR family, phosphate regulon sensor histidine kinase PhoR